MNKHNKRRSYVPKRSKPLLSVAIAATLIGVASNAYATINEFNAGMINSGTGPFDTNDNPGNDSGESNDVIRSADSATYRVAYSLDNSDTGSLITLDLTNKVVLPAGYTGSSSGAYFDPVQLPTSCKNVSNPLSSEPPPVGQSGVSANGLKVWCATPSSTSADNVDFIVNIATDAPNGTVVPAPDITYQSDNNPIDSTPGILTGNAGNQAYHGLPDLTVSAAPRWQVGKNTGNYYLYAKYIPGSGPNGEDGYVLGYNIGVYATGSRKGLEALAPDFSIAENFADSDTPNAQLVTWNMNIPGFIASDFSAATGANGCGDWGNNFPALGNFIDNGFHYPGDRGTTDSTSTFKVARGGQCDADSVDNIAKTATLHFTGVDASLNHYPTRRGYGGAVGTLVDPNDLDKSSNQWWISSKVIAIWVPLSDFTPGVTEVFTNTVTLADAQSVTGQINPTSTDSGNLTVRVTTAGGFTKRYAPAEYYWNFPASAGYTFAKRDAAYLGDSLIKDAAPGNLASARLGLINTGATPLSGHICEKIDNTRLTFFDARNYNKPNVDITKYHYDANTGIYNRYLSGTTANTVINWQLGVGGNDISNGTWTDIDTVDANTETAVYSTPDNLSSAHRMATCEDSDATWYDSIDDLTAAGHTLREITRVRGSYTNLSGGVYILSFIPFQVNNTFAYDANDQSNGDGSRTTIAGTTVNDTYAPNQAHMDNGAGTKRRSAILRIRDNEYVDVTKTAADPAETENEAVSAGALINYQVQINATSTTSEHATTIRVWDVFPQYVSYVPGTTQLGGAAIADPTCFGEGVTPPAPAPFAANSVGAGYNACYWDIDSTVKLLNAGDPAGNLPLLTFQGYVSTSAPNTTQILNATAVDSTNNAYTDAIYEGASTAFRCPRRRVCSFDSYNLVISATPGLVLNKVVNKGVIPVGGNYSYSLFYTMLDTGLQNLRILDVLPYAGDSRGSNYSGTGELTGPIAKPIAGAGVPATVADNDIIIYYTNNTPADINRDPYDSGHNLTGTGNNSATATNWCTETQVGNLATCPADFASVTGILALPQGGGDQTVDAGDIFELIVPIQTNANAANDRYDNAFIADSPDLAARRPGSNIVNTVVKAADLVMTKKVTNASIASGDNSEFILTVSNNSIANNPDVGPLFAAPIPTVTVSDNLPAGMTAQLPIAATDWDCSASTPTQINCIYTGALPVAAGSPVGGAIAITVLTPAPGTYANTATVTVTGQAESDDTNNSATTQLTVNPPPTIVSVSDATVTEGTDLVQTVTLNKTTTNPTTYPFSLTDGTATAGSDYKNAPSFNNGVTYDSNTGLITVPAGVTDFTVTYPTTVDAIADNGETAKLTVGGVTGTGTINDPAAPTVASVSDATVTEGTDLVQTVTLSGPTANPVTYPFSLTDGTATAGSDYKNTPSFSNGVTYDSNTGLITVPAGVTDFTVTYPTTVDAIADNGETTKLTVGGVTGTGTINDPAAPTIASVSDATVTEGTDLVQTVTLSGPTANPVTYPFSLTDGTATAGSDYENTPTFSNGVTYDSNTGEITVPAGVTDFTVTYPTTVDTVADNDETTKLTVGGVTGTGTINDPVVSKPAKIPSTGIWLLLFLVGLMGLLAYRRRQKIS